MFDILDLFQVKENVNPNIQLWVDALRYYDEDAIDSLAADVWITARTIEDYTMMPAVIQNILLSALKFAVVNHTVKANPDMDAETLKSHLRFHIDYHCHGTDAYFAVDGEKLVDLEDIKCAVNELKGWTIPY